MDKLTVRDFDLSGTWMVTAVIDGCGTNKTEKWTVEIAQKGGSITAKNIDKGLKWKGKISNNIISVSETYSGAINRESFKLKVSGDANTLTGEAKWDYQGVCFGTNNLPCREIDRLYFLEVHRKAISG